MVFLGGPRQVGKTTMATSLTSKYYDDHPAYLNWDNEQARKKILKSEWPKDEPLIVFLEKEETLCLVVITTTEPTLTLYLS
jgi:hypothetical protein